MNIQIKKILIEVINSSYPKSGRPSSKEIEHYLDVILYVLNSDINKLSVGISLLFYEMIYMFSHHDLFILAVKIREIEIFW